MQSFENILIYHAGAIGDTVLATPVAAALHRHYPSAHMVQISHHANLELLALTGNLDSSYACESASNWMELRKFIAKLKPDLIVDLSDSTKSWLTTQFQNKARLLCYKKQPWSNRTIMHAADNFLATLEPLAIPRLPKLFPTLSIPSHLTQIAKEKTAAAQSIVACVAGVGRLRSHRVWGKSSWIELIQALQKANKFPVLIGGSDDFEVCNEIAKAADALNLAGSLSLCETAAVLKLSELAVSCDTGPAHIAVAVGTPVVGMYGPTYAERSGPYGYLDRCINVSSKCSCMQLKSCAVTAQPGPGYCMEQISVDDVLQKIL
jgi:ADP-heptose:LPS heptosyltransferase